MGKNNVSTTTGIASTIVEDVSSRFVSSGSRSRGSLPALPGFQLINDAVDSLKGVICDGGGVTCKKVAAYLGYRLISYSMLPTVFNLVSLLVSGILGILTLPLRLCDRSRSLNDWCWERFGGSLGHFLGSLYDLTCDFRQITGRCCCPPESAYLRV